MALITIKDLPQSDDLDREAMRSIVGGASTAVRPVQIDQVEPLSDRILEYPPGFRLTVREGRRRYGGQ